MDQKKNLKPELKEIYERVMNTPTGAANKAAPSHTDQTPSANPVSSPQTHTTQPSTAQAKPEFLASVPPRQITTPPAKEFVFSAKNQHEDKKPEHHETTSPTHKASGGSLFNGKVLILGVIFVLVWTMFWLVLLGVVQPASFGL